MVYDLIILGGGPAGYVAAERAGRAGLNTLCIEERTVGGTCLNEGCIPTKALLYSAKIYGYATHGEAYGVTVAGASIDHARALAHKDKVVRTLVSGVCAQLETSGAAFLSARGAITGRSTDGYTVLADGQTYTGKNLLIATGSRAAVAPIPGLRQGLAAGYVLTNREILNLAQVPKQLVVIGGGVIGLEMAAYYQACGSEVTVVEMLDHIAGDTDADICKLLQKSYEKRGIRFILGARVTEVAANGVTCQTQDGPYTAEADKVLLSIGRSACTKDIGLARIGVDTQRGAIVTDERMRTNVPGVYAAGDVNGKSMLAHTAYREAEVAVNNMRGKHDIMRYDAIPAVIYTSPEVASVGQTEAGARAAGFDVTVVRTSMRYSGRYVAENESGDGICKLVIDKRRRRLLGAQVMANYASEFIVAAGIMIEAELTIEDIKELVFPHPTVCEILREAVFQVQ